MITDPKLTTESSLEILKLEFEYARETAGQAIDDRYKLLNFYIGLATTVGTLVLGIITLGGGVTTTGVNLAIATLCLGIATIGWLFLLMFIRLRQAWHGSVRALNRIKEYFLQHSVPGLEEALVWRSATLPRPQQLWNIHFYAVVLIAIIGSVYWAVGWWIVLISLDAGETAIFFPLGSAILSFFVQLLVYHFSLKYNN